MLDDPTSLAPGVTGAGRQRAGGGEVQRERQSLRLGDREIERVGQWKTERLGEETDGP